MIEIGIGIAIIIVASAVHKYVEGRNKGMPGDVERRLLERIDDLERRITDIQDIVISVDEKLKRQDRA